MKDFNYAYIINQIEKYYAKDFTFLVKLTLQKSKEARDNLGLLFGVIEPVFKTTSTKNMNEYLEYDSVLYRSIVITKEEMIKLLTIFATSTKITLAQEEESNYVVPEDIKKKLKTEERIIPIKADFKISLACLEQNDKIQYYESDPSIDQSEIDNKLGFYSLDFSRKKTTPKLDTELLALDQPFYPDVAELILKKYKFDIGRHSAFKEHLLLRLPQYHIGEIELIEFVDDNINYKIRLFQKINAVLKIYIKDRQQNVGSTNSIKITKKITEASFPITIHPHDIHAVLIDDAGKIIHKRLKRWHGPSELSKKPEAILKKIEGGEGVKCDFKEQLPPYDKIVKLVCAFANTEGGDLILGVDDDANIIGIIYPLGPFADFNAIEVHIQNLVDTNVVPPIKVDGFTVTLQDISGNDQEIGVIRVAESNKLVANQFNKSIIQYNIRRGSTNRIATPMEISELILRKNRTTF